MAVLKWIGIGLLGLLVLVAAGVAFAFTMFDWNHLRGFAARQATQALGREVAIDGDLRVSFGDPIHIRLEGLRVANPDWAAEKTFAELKVLDADLRLWPLLRGDIELPKLALTEPKLDMEKNDRGENNWTFQSNPQKAVEPKNRYQIPIIERLVIDGGRVRYRDPASDIDVNTTISTATGENGEDAVTLDGQGNFAGKPFTMAVQGGGLKFLRDTSEPYPIRIDAAVGTTKGKAEGSVKDPVTMQGADFSIALSGDDMAEIFPIFGIPVPKTRPYSLAGHLGRKGEVWTFEGMQGKVGESDLSGTVAVDLSRKQPDIRGDLSSTRLAAIDLAGFVGASPRGRKDYPTKGRDRVLPATQIDLKRLRAANMNVHFRGNRVEAPIAPLDTLDAQIKLDNGVLTLDPVKLGMADGQIAGSVILDGRDRDTPAMETALDIRNVKVAEFFRDTQFAKDMGGTLTGRLELAGKGPTVADILATANGKLGLAVDGGRISSLVVAGLKTNILETLGVALSGSEPLPFNCFVTEGIAENGLLRVNALVLDTPETLVTGDGTINLRTEHLDLRLEGRAKKPQVFATHVPVNVRGSLGSPDIGVDATESAARGAAAIALGVLLTPLASILPLLEPGTDAQPHCGQLIQDAKSPPSKGETSPGKASSSRGER